jgi:hypothetical protein
MFTRMAEIKTNAKCSKDVEQLECSRMLVRIQNIIVISE